MIKGALYMKLPNFFNPLSKRTLICYYDIWLYMLELLVIQAVS